MKYFKFSLIAAAAATLFGCAQAVSTSQSLENSRYALTLTDGVIEFSSKQDGGTWEIKPEFTVLETSANPKTTMSPAGLGDGILYNVASWEAKNIPASAVLKKAAANADYVGDGFDQSALKAKADGRTASVFHSAPKTLMKAKALSISGGEIVMAFEDSADFTLGAKIVMPDGDAEPVLRFTFTPKKDAYYSVGFTGSPAFSLDELDGVWQPFIWQEKRVPKQSFMTLSYHCTLPSAFVSKDGATFGVVADTSEMPFSPLPVYESSAFGVVLRTEDGKFSSMIFAPALGMGKSKMKAGESFSFTARLFSQKGDITDAYEAAARRLYKMRDYRSNATGSLNGTIENMTELAMSKYAYFEDDNKGCSYVTDAPGTVKNVSALNPYEIALLADRKDVFDKRAYPILEYLLSREKFLFAMDRKQKIQSPSSNLNGPATPVSEMAVFYGLSNGASPIFMNYAKELFPKERILNLQEISGGSAWQDALDIYINGGGDDFLKKAVKGADEYIAKNIDSPLTEYKDQSFFWTSFAPPFSDFYRLYKATGDKKYLEAARHAARLYSMYIWMCPQIPNEKVVVNPDGKAPWYGYTKGKGYPQMDAEREEVDAWRLSEIGLTPESSGTMRGHRAIFMANFAPWFMRIGSESGDKFLCDIARSAVVGRYSNFPGYHINTARTTVYEKSGYPLKDAKLQSVNSFHYNHIMPMVSMLYDYLISDVEVRAGGKISFPFRYIEGYSYMQSNFYGDRPGEFFGRKNVWLWMPAKLLECSSDELNYVSARGENGGLYLSFANQSRRSILAKITLNKSLVNFEEGGEYEAVFYKNAEEPESKKGVVKNGVFEVDVSGMGLTSVAIDALKVAPKFQQTLQNIPANSAWKKGFASLKAGNAVAMVLNFGAEQTTVFAYLKDTEESVKAARFTYGENGQTVTLTDSTYPYEFTVKLPAGCKSFKFAIEVDRLDGSSVREDAAFEK